MSKAKIIEAATKLAAKIGYTNLTRSAIAEKLKIPPSSVSFHCGGMDVVRALVVQHAIDTENLTVVAQALAHHNPLAMRAAAELRARAVNHVRLG